MQAADKLTAYLQQQPSRPHAVHAHYADATYVCSKACSVLALPLVLTTHSLGRLKRERLLAQNYTEDEIVRGAAVTAPMS